MQPTSLTDRLADASYEEAFFQDAGARILESPGATEALETLAASSEASPKVRVLAHELLVDAGREPDPALAKAYCAALPEAFAHNAWGMPGQYVERLGATVVRFGQAAVPCLAAMLNDDRPLGYFGSEEPTLNDEMDYRVRDLAADLLCRISGDTFPGDEALSDRAAFIRDLSRRLNRSAPG